jgi:hypothetical protein
MLQSSLPALKLNTIVSSSHSVSKRANCFFIALFALFSLDFGFIKPKSTIAKLLVALWGILQASTISYIVINYFTSTHGVILFTFWQVKYVLEYYIVAVAIYIFNKSNLFQFWQNLSIIDKKLGCENGIKKIEIVAISMTVYAICYRSISSLCYCTYFAKYCIKSKAAIVSYHFPLLGMDSFLIIYFIIFFSVYCRLKMFVSLVKNGNRDIIFCHYLYKFMIESTGSGKRVFDYMVSNVLLLLF